MRKAFWIRSILMIAGFLLALLPGGVRAQGETTLAVSPEVEEIAVGDTFEVTLKIRDVLQLNAVDFKLLYDAEVLEQVCDYGTGKNQCWQTGGFLENLLVFVERKTVGSYHLVVVQGNKPDQTGTGDLLTLKFKGIAHGTSPLTISEAYFANRAGDMLIPALENAEVAVKTVPAAAAKAYEMAKNTELVIAAPGVLTGDSGGPGAVLTAVLETGIPVSEGTLDLGSDGGFTYTPLENWIGTTDFTYRACDGTICSAPATVTIAVKTIPTALQDAYEGAENKGMVVDAAQGLLANDSGDVGALLTAVLETGLPAGEGTLDLGSDGGFTYTPPTDWTGTTYFTYRACDGQICSPSTAVTLTVKTVPQAFDDDYQMAAGTCLEIDSPGLLGNDTGGSDAVLTAELVQGLPAGQGELVFSPQGGFRYEPPEDFTGAVSFTYRACDGGICSTPATVSIAVKTVPTARDDAYEMTINEVLSVDAPGLLENDSGDVAERLQVEQLSALDPDQGVLVVNQDGSFTYTPPEDWRGVIRFNYRACDGLICSSAATVEIEVFPPRLHLKGKVSLQGQGNSSGVPFMLVGQNYGYIYPVESTAMVSYNLDFGKVVIDTYLVITAQPRYLNIPADLEFYFTLIEAMNLPPLELKGGNALWTDNVINLSDASVVGAFWGLKLEDMEEGQELLGDVNFDGEVNIQDLSLVGGNYRLTSEEAYAEWLNGE